MKKPKSLLTALLLLTLFTTAAACSEGEGLREWHYVAGYDEVDARHSPINEYATDTFYSRGKKLRILWTAEPDLSCLESPENDSPRGYIDIAVLKEHDPRNHDSERDMIDFDSAELASQTSGTFHFDVGPDAYYLEIGTLCIKSWDIEVETYW